MGAIRFVGAVQLKTFGAGIYVANLVGIASVRELTPILTAIVLAGRTGASFAARIATMQGNEEVDALTVLRVSAAEFLVLPRVVALSLLMPLLYVLAAPSRCSAAWRYPCRSWTCPRPPTRQTQHAIAGAHFAIGALKAFAFGGLVALIGCHHGLRGAAQRGGRRIRDDLGRRSLDHRRHRPGRGIRRVRQRAEGLNMISIEDLIVGYGPHPVQPASARRSARARSSRSSATAAPARAPCSGR